MADQETMRLGHLWLFSNGDIWQLIPIAGTRGGRYVVTIWQLIPIAGTRGGRYVVTNETSRSRVGRNMTMEQIRGLLPYLGQTKLLVEEIEVLTPEAPRLDSERGAVTR